MEGGQTNQSRYPVRKRRRLVREAIAQPRKRQACGGPGRRGNEPTQDITQLRRLMNGKRTLVGEGCRHGGIYSVVAVAALGKTE